jgi:hypothetical protein
MNETIERAQRRALIEENIFQTGKRSEDSRKEATVIINESERKGKTVFLKSIHPAYGKESLKKRNRINKDEQGYSSNKAKSATSSLMMHSTMKNCINIKRISI